jgi:hypothetical protein
VKDWEEIVKGKISDEQIAGLKAYDSELNKTVQLVSVLQDDYNVVLRELQKDWDNYLRRRVVVRALFALVEGAVFALKSQVLLKYDRGDCELSRKEREKLLERKLDSAGNPTDSPRFLPLKDNIKFVFHIYAQKVGDITFRFDFDTRWDDFRDAIEIRNSLTHPKSLDDLNVNDSKLKRVLRAAEWFNEQWGNLMTGVHEAIKRSVNAQF